jgi:hypothetical protein
MMELRMNFKSIRVNILFKISNNSAFKIQFMIFWKIRSSCKEIHGEISLGGTEEYD